ncbi:hypothetical protein ACTMTI_07500 [Nonomuraea sp. H19]|uniref:hypothetical protein n=1 Tax=Nonomuraea sp. H19 TaxID=3452206 RepID=UPI003F8A0820
MSLLDQITTRLVAAAERADHLRTRLAEAEDDLDRLRVAGQVVKGILTEQPSREPAEEPAGLTTASGHVTQFSIGTGR